MKQRLIILCGIPFSGKTTLSKLLSPKYGFQRIDLDDVKFQLYGMDILDEQLRQDDWDKVYQEMYKQIDESLTDGKAVVHDTGNFTTHERSLVRQIAEKLGIEAVTVYVNTPVEIARQRLLENRESQSRFDVTDEAFDSAIAEMEPPQTSEKHLVIEERDNVLKWINENLL